MIQLLFDLAKEVAAISGAIEGMLLSISMLKRIFWRAAPAVQPLLPSIYRAFGLLFAISTAVVIIWMT
ncbi:MAG: hypothetical protein ACP5MK_00040 [Candidatus Micrarchaeia archaeon]